MKLKWKKRKEFLLRIIKTKKKKKNKHNQTTHCELQSLLTTSKLCLLFFGCFLFAFLHFSNYNLHLFFFFFFARFTPIIIPNNPKKKKKKKYILDFSIPSYYPSSPCSPFSPLYHWPSKKFALSKFAKFCKYVLLVNASSFFFFFSFLAIKLISCFLFLFYC